MTYYAKDGEPITLGRWCDLSVDDAYRVIGRDEVEGRRVTTIWIGLHNGDGRIFESTVVDADPTAYSDELDARRYRTEAEAQAGHAELVAQWLGGDR